MGQIKIEVVTCFIQQQCLQPRHKFVNQIKTSHMSWKETYTTIQQCQLLDVRATL